MKKLKLLKQQFPDIVKGAAVEALNSRVGRIGMGAAALGGMTGSAHAQAAAAPIDFTATGTTIAGYVPNAATAGLTVFAAVFGVIIIKKVFMVVA